jgi:hypothetical protein
MVALSHPCNMLPIAAAMATSTAPLISTTLVFQGKNQQLLHPWMLHFFK